MTSDPVGTYCSHCDRAYDPSPTEPYRCACGAPLELLDRGHPSQLPTSPIGGLWDFTDALPHGPAVDIGAGGTPLVDAPHFDASFKLESCNPTGSFKDRGAAVTLSRALGLGVEQVKEDSSGNAGLAIASHAARANIDAIIFVPDSASGSILNAIDATGAEVRPIEGDRAAVATAAIETDAGWYASHAWRPEFYEGTATMAWELLADRGGTPPEAIVLPVGHGTLLLGLYRGFSRLQNADLLERVPRLYAAQLEGAGSLLSGRTSVDSTVAPGIRIAESARQQQLIRAIEASGGEVVPVDPTAVGPARNRLAQAGFDVCTTSSVALLGREQLLESQSESADSDVIVVLTGRARDR